jgi:hypothetical protein
MEQPTRCLTEVSRSRKRNPAIAGSITLTDSYPAPDGACFENMRHDAIRFTLQERAFMTRQTTFLVQAFNSSKGAGLKANAPVACRSAESARRTAERLALNNLGVVGFSVTADPETGDYDDQPTVFFRAGQLPSEFDLMP